MKPEQPRDYPAWHETETPAQPPKCPVLAVVGIIVGLAFAGWWLW